MPAYLEVEVEWHLLFLHVFVEIHMLHGQVHRTLQALVAAINDFLWEPREGFSNILQVTP